MAVDLDLEVVIGVAIVGDQNATIVIAGQFDLIGIDSIERCQVCIAIIKDDRCVLIIGCSLKLGCNCGANWDISSND